MHQLCAANKDLFQKKQKAKSEKENKPFPKLFFTRDLSWF
jgi:ribosomal protein L39E